MAFSNHLYTIEQIELLRRIRNSGLSKDQVINAFDAFEKVEAELGNLYNVPTTMTRAMNGPTLTPAINSNLLGLNRRWQFHGPTRQMKEPLNDSDAKGTVNTQGSSLAPPKEEDSMDLSCESPSDQLKKPPLDFSQERQLQPSAFICGSSSASDFNMSQGAVDKKVLLESEGLAVNFAPRRERFTFRKEHLEVLEKYFKTNQYPSFEERSEIAQRCNDIMVLAWGRSLGEKEKMSHQNVAYWFSNRRKDIKRLAKEGGIETTEVILPSKISKTPSALSLDSDSSFYSSWPGDMGGSNSYTPLMAPVVGPVVFPGFLQMGGTNSLLAPLDLDGASSNSQDMQQSEDGCAQGSESKCAQSNDGKCTPTGSPNDSAHVADAVRISSSLFHKTSTSPLPVPTEMAGESSAVNSIGKRDPGDPSVVVKLEPKDSGDESY